MEKIILRIRFFLFIISIVFGLSVAMAKEVNLPKGSVLNDILWSNPEAGQRFDNYFYGLKFKEFDPLRFKIQMDAISQELLKEGYYMAKLNARPVAMNSMWNIEINLDFNTRINFEFRGNTLFLSQAIKSHLVEKVKNEFGKIDIPNLEKSIVELYEGKGFFHTHVKTRVIEGVNRSNGKVINYYFEITEGQKIKIRNLNFRGNLFFSEEQLRDLYNKSGSDLAQGGYYDLAYLVEFTDILKKEYLRNGYVFIDVSKARVIATQDKSYDVEYSISEKHQVLVGQIEFKKIPDELANAVRAKLSNQENQPVNIVDMEADLRRMITTFQNEGYYFATIANLNSDKLIVYDPTFTSVDIRPDILLDKKICFNDAIINGNIHTKTKVIYREIELLEGEIITPAKLEHLRQKLSGLNLFSTLKITPYIVHDSQKKDCPKTNLIIQVQEKDFGLIEVAPGFRTDLGAKLSTGITYNNFTGMNRSVSFRLQGNRRFNLTGFDERRKREDKDLIEHSAKFNFIEPYLLHSFLKTQVEFETSISAQRNRYYGFDADIFRVSPQISKTFNKWFSTSVSYQFERIVQFDATVEKDNDDFFIGGITPTITFDFRDDVINPRKGAFFTLSSEWANSNFGSMKQEDLEVNFIKVINRNKFYYPFGDFTLAISVAMGYQKNFADEILKDFSGSPIINANGKPKTRGYIPSIKVFRLNGYDEIRGYDDFEINRLMDGTPIGEVIVQGEAYFAALKIEQRYNISDNIRVGVFADAGRVYVDEFNPTSLRTSVGAGLKFVTPVGSLDFDYGFKLQRKEYGPSVRDSAGRFHLSIGFF